MLQVKEKPLLTAKQKKNRLRWSKEHMSWTSHQWDAIQWSDEARFEVCVGDSRSRVIRKKHEAFHPDCLKRKVKFPASVMVWGSMSSKGIGKLHFIEGIVNTNKYLDIFDIRERFCISTEWSRVSHVKKSSKMDGRLRCSTFGMGF